MDEQLRNLITERILRADDAAHTALSIMTSSKMPKQVFHVDFSELNKQFILFFWGGGEGWSR